MREPLSVLRARYQFMRPQGSQGPRAQKPAPAPIPDASEVRRMPQSWAPRVVEPPVVEPPVTGMVPLGSALEGAMASLNAMKAAEPALVKPPETPDSEWPANESLSEAHFEVSSVVYSTPWQDREDVLEGRVAIRCGRCENESGEIWVKGADGREKPHPCRCAAARRRARALKSARIPASLADKPLDKYETSRLTDPVAVEDMLSGFREAFAPGTSKEEQKRFPGVLLAGAVGVGKTHLAGGMLRWAIARGHTGRWVNWPNFCKAVKASWDCDSVTEAQLLSDAVDGELIVLNELRVDFGGTGEWALALLYDFLERALSRRCRLIVTTNLTGNKLATGLDARCASRLKELAPTLEMVGPDSRGLVSMPAPSKPRGFTLIPGGSPWP